MTIKQLNQKQQYLKNRSGFLNKITCLSSEVISSVLEGLLTISPLTFTCYFSNYFVCNLDSVVKYLSSSI